MPDDALIIVVVYVLFALLPAAIAPSRGRTPLNWFMASLIASPLIALILVILLPSKKTGEH
jgi:hypothetical protein